MDFGHRGLIFFIKTLTIRAKYETGVSITTSTFKALDNKNFTPISKNIPKYNFFVYSKKNHKFVNLPQILANEGLFSSGKYQLHVENMKPGLPYRCHFFKNFYIKFELCFFSKKLHFLKTFCSLASKLLQKINIFAQKICKKL